MTHKTVPVEPTKYCKCDLRTRLVGDGCVICNPEYAADHAAPPSPDSKSNEVTELERELRAALWHIKNTAVSLADAQVIALEALAAYEAKKGK